jgi:hypothetical protein
MVAGAGASLGLAAEMLVANGRIRTGKRHPERTVPHGSHADRGRRRHGLWTAIRANVVERNRVEGG